MIQTFQDKPKPRFSDQILEGLSRASSQASTEIPRLMGERMENEKRKAQQAAGNKQFKDMFGIDLEGYSPEERKFFIQEALKQQTQQMSQAHQLAGKQQEKLAPLKQGLETLKRQRERLATGQLGPKVSFNPSQESKLFKSMTREGQQIRSEYEQAGKELIQLASTLPIRNQAEFKTLANRLYDPNLKEAEIKGILNEMEDHIRDAIASHGGERGESFEKSPSKQKRRPISSFGG